MKDLKFKTYAVTNEIDLNKIAVECNIKKKYTWEEPLILQGKILKTIINYVNEDEIVLVFSFGSIVFINSISSRKIFDIFSDYFELTERYDNLSNRINVLDSITEEYFSFRSNQSERRLLLFEILLLCLFPLMYLFP